MDRLAIIDAESQRLAEVLSVADPALCCPTCPDWAASDLLWHLTSVHFFWAGVLSHMIQSDADVAGVERAKPARPAAVDELLVLRERATTELLGQLSDHDDAEPCWSWWPPDQTVGFTRRMQTYEATMHRVDAELTAGLPISPLAEDVAAGAIDHAVDVMWAWMPDGVDYHAHAVVEFVAADTDQRWPVEVGRWTGPAGNAPRAVRAASGEPSATVTAPVADLALWAWTRGGAAQISGRPESRAALDALIDHGMP